MKKIKFKEICTLKGKEYQKGDTFKPSLDDMSLIIRLNEKGFIEPLTESDLKDIYNSLSKPKEGGDVNGESN